MQKGFSSLRCGLIGEHLGHSFSPQIHAHLADYSYRLIELPPDGVGTFLQKGDFDAINVTIPYKKTVMPYLHHISREAKAIGAVNTVVWDRDGTLHGYNTDYFGFSYMVKLSGIDVAGKKVLVLGSGGASVTVCAVLADMGAQVVVISRKGENNYDNLSRHADAQVIVNTTPVGMFPNNGESPVSLSLFPKLGGVLDVIYNPARTQLLLDAEEMGIPCLNGLPMLTAQAARAAEYFTGIPVPDAEIAKVTRAVAAQMQNIVLIGMPGCGKSTVGKLLAARCGKTFHDADEVFSQTYPLTPAQIIREQGEAAFRRMEHEVLCSLGKLSSCVIATGGGAVTQAYNYAPLHQNGIIVWIDRHPDNLPTEGRPLSQAKGVHTLYAERVDAYRRFADCTVVSNEVLEDTLSAICDRIQDSNK